MNIDTERRNVTLPRMERLGYSFLKERSVLIMLIKVGEMYSRMGGWS